MSESLTISVDLLAPQLYDRHENDHWLITKVGISARKTAEELLGPKHWIAKLVTIGVIIADVGPDQFFQSAARCFQYCLDGYRPTYHVTAPITFAAVEKRSIVRPFDGQIDQVWAMPGRTGEGRAISCSR